MLITKKVLSSLIQYSARWDWLALILITPFLLFPTPARTPALLAIPLLWLVIWIADGEPLVSTPLNGTLLLLSIMVLVSTWATYDIAFSLPKISGMVLAMGVFFAVVRAGKRSTAWWFILILYLGIGLGIAVLGAAGTRWPTDKLGFLDSVLAQLPSIMQGLPGAVNGFHPNEVAGALTWVLPLYAALIIAMLFNIRGVWQTWGVWRTVFALLALGLAGLIAVAVFILTQSRGGYIGFAVSLLVMLFIALPRRWRWIYLGAVILVGVSLAFFISDVGVDGITEQIFAGGVVSDQALSLNTLEGRVEIWSRSIYGLQDFPFTGMGMNTFREVVHVLYPLFLISPDADIGHAHNEFLQVGLDLGIPGLIAFIALYLGAFWMLVGVWKNARRSQLLTPDPQLATSSPPPVTHHFPLSMGSLQRAAVLGLGGGLLAHLIYGLTDAVAMGAKPGVVFWMLLGLVAGLHRQACSGVREQDLV